MYKSTRNPMFRSSFAEDIFNQKYSHEDCETYAALCEVLVHDVCEGLMTGDEMEQLIEYMVKMYFIPGGRYLYYAGRDRKFFNNCFLLKAEEDTREDWAELSKKTELCLSTGGGIGVDYSIYRPSGSTLFGTGGVASGPLAKMQMVNEIGRGIIQGGSRRSALYASLGWKHGDVYDFLHIKNWHDIAVAGTGGKTVADLKEANFDFRAPMDMTNISVNYDTDWLMRYWETGEVGDVFKTNVHQAIATGEPGFSFNFFGQEGETLRNACCEVTSSDDSDVCNLGSINLGRIDSILELRDVIRLATKFLVCGSLRAHLPYDKVNAVREKNRRLGLGLMGIHEWLLKKGLGYEVTGELKRWLSVYRDVSRSVATGFAAKLSVSNPVACRAIAPTGSIGILAGTTTGIEPLFAVAYKRRYLKGTRWHHQYVVDSVAQQMIEEYSVDPEKIDSALSLVDNFERRITVQADVQDFVDMAISSTINLPKWTPDKAENGFVAHFTDVLAKHAHRLRGFTVYPDGSRGGQPLTAVPYKEAKDKLGEAFEESVEVVDICDITGKGGVCGV
tara:strand:+ start:544 stop:2223 length:1680 start_codon:yes stop_codon:yes gene_type:complete